MNDRLRQFANCHCIGETCDCRSEGSDSDSDSTISTRSTMISISLSSTSVDDADDQAFFNERRFNFYFSYTVDGQNPNVTFEKPNKI